MGFFSKLFNNNSNNNINYQSYLMLYLKNNNMTLDDLETIFIVDGNFVIKRNNYKTITTTGKLEKGHIKSGDILYYIDENLQRIPVKIICIEKFRQLLLEANAGDSIGISTDISIKLPDNSYLFKN